MRNNRITRLYLTLWATADNPLSRKDLMKLLQLSPFQVDDDVRFLHREKLVTLSGPTDERERVKSKVLPKLEVLQERYQTRRTVRDYDDEDGEEEMHPEDLLE